MPGCNLVSVLVRLERSRPGEDMERAVGALIEWGQGEDELERAFAAWMGQVLIPRHSGEKEPAPGTNLEEIRTMLAERVQEWYAREREKGREQGFEQGREQGLRKGLRVGLELGREEGLEQGLEKGREEGRAAQRALLGRLAAGKFGAATAEAFAARLAEIADRHRALEIGEWIIECEEGRELLQRVERLGATPADGDGPSRDERQGPRSGVGGARVLERAIVEWIGQVMVPRHSVGEEEHSLGTSLEEIRTMLAERMREWYAREREKGLRAGLQEGFEQGLGEGLRVGLEVGREEGLEQGLEKGREEGRAVQRALLGRLTAGKFGATSAERLGAASADGDTSSRE